MSKPTQSGQQRAFGTLRAVVQAVALAAPAVLAMSAVQTVSAASPSYYEFESGHVRPLAKSADGTKLFVVNTPNGTLDVFNINGSTLSLAARVPVGMEPVAVAVRSANEVWVVNHLSDSVSIVSLDGTPHVSRTLLVGDEPRDIVFAGSPAKAFITTAHRGQHRTDASIASVPGAGDPKLTTPGVGRADVWVFNPDSLGAALGGIPSKIMTFFADTPRALAVSPDKNTLYVASFKSGNQTATVDEQVVCDGFNTTKTCIIKSVTYPGGQPGPGTNIEGKEAPETGMIVKYNKTSKKWEDELGRDWSKAVPFNLPDKDVFAVDANSLTEKTSYASVGNTLFNMVANPVTGALYVSNLDVNNMQRFEGPGVYGKSTLQGKIALARVSVISNGTVQARHLNKHIDYTKLADNPAFDATAKNHSLALPLEMAVTKDGKTLFVTAYGSNKIGVFNTADIENDTFNPRTASAGYVKLSGIGGPSGVVLDEDKGQMYVTTRFDNSVKVVSLTSKSEVSTVALKNPEPANIIAGRPFLYDAFKTSANGEASCASCHIFGDDDATAWNLGNPDDVVTSAAIPGKFIDKTQFPLAKLLFNVKSKINGDDNPNTFHPMKGPMMTQTLHGMRNSGAMHWRGDRATGLYGSDLHDSNVSFLNFGGAFQGLVGAAQPMPKEDMQKFADYQLNTYLPPNPVRNLDNTLTAAQQRGKDFYFGARPSDGVKLINTATFQTSQNCNGCHMLDPAQGFYGTSGMRTFEGLPQTVKVAPLRNLYNRVGMFGAPDMPFFSLAGTGSTGDQVRGYGFTHDGAVDTIFRFFHAIVFRNQVGAGFPTGTTGTQNRADLEQYVLAYDSDLAPIVGQQITLNSTNATQVGARIDLLIARAKAPFVSKEAGGNVTECDLVASVVEGGSARGYFFNVASSAFTAQDGTTRTDAALRALAKNAGQEVTYTCTPPGSGARVAFDR
jgi:DNA-binding beta-propeller fold protein YncE